MGGRWRRRPAWGALVALVLVFPLLRSRPGCVRQVRLWLRVLRFDEPQPEKVPGC
jgi:hypothetical protein